MKTKRMGADNITFLVDKLGEECSPTQQLREFVQNSCEAIQRVQADDPSYEGKIVIDFDPEWTDRCGAAKLSITDNGEGMTAAELQRYMNNLSSSGRSQALDANFGVGAKIASLSLNPHGVIFESWKQDAGHMIHIWKDRSEGTYGLKPIADSSGIEEYVPQLNDDVRPDIVRRHGTRVVLLGASDDDNTCRAPADEAAASEWLVKTLNRRYFCFPDNIEITARTSPWKADNRNACPRRSVRGQKNMLDACCVTQGDVSLHGATAHWWLMPTDDDDWRGRQDATGATNSKAGWANKYETNGHIAVLTRNELYLHHFGNGARFILQEFGVTRGYSAVIIYVEPDSVAVNMARTMPQFEGNEPPWAEWGAEFRRKMPKAIADYVEALHQKADTSIDEEIRKYMEGMLDLFAPPRFLPQKNGAHAADPSVLTPGGNPEPVPPEPARTSRPATPPSPPRPRPGRRGHNYSDRLKPKGVEARSVAMPAPPRVEWESSPDFGDVAAIFVPEANVIRANEDFRFFPQIAERIEKEFTGRPGARAVIWRHIKKWFGTQLVEVVLGVQTLASTRSDVWQPDTVQQMLRPEALTLAVCIRGHAVSLIRTAAAATLGRATTPPGPQGGEVRGSTARER